jgi:hypothetical protein
MPVSVSNLRDQKLALLLWYLDLNQDSKAALLFGRLRCKGKEVILDRGEALPPLPLSPLLLRNVQEVPDDLKDLMGDASYFLQITANDIPQPEPEEDFEAFLPNYYQAG